MSMRNTTIHYLAVACTCLLLAACGEDGETTDSIAASGGGGSGSSSPGIHGRVQFSAATFEVNENAGNASVTLTRTEGTQGAVSVSVASRNGTATAAADYTAVATTVTFGDGDAAAKTVLVPIINDVTVESSETLYLTLTTPTGGAGVGTASETLLTIIDDDIAPPAAPTAAISAVYKQLRIDWTAASGATSYRLMKDPTGNAGYAQVGADLPATQRSADVEVVVSKEDWLNARYAVAACNAAGCTQSTALSVAGLSTPLIGYLKASNTAGFASFGTAVALSADGNTLAVGAPYEDSAATGINDNQVYTCSGAVPANCAYDSGAVYVYTRSGSAWSAPVYIKASNAESTDAFGSTLSLSADGNTLAVAATGEGSANTNQADNSADGAGAVYVFTRASGAWSQAAYLKASDATQQNAFGTTLALSPDGELLAIGAPYRTTTQYGTGAAYVFTRAGTSWSESVNLPVPTPLETGYFGSGLAIVGGSAPTLVVGSDGALGSGGIARAGVAYVYTRAGAIWSQAAVMTSSTQATDGQFGSAVALSADGTTLAIGAGAEDVVTSSGATVVRAGAIHVYTRSGSNWNPVTRLTAANPSYSGFGQTLAISADGSTLAAGAVDEDGGAAGINGAPDTTMQSAGAAYLFTTTASGWSQRSYVKASNPETNDFFGGSVALSANGDILVVGSNDDDSAATDLNGNQLDDCGAAAATNCANGSGALYIY